MKFFSIAFVAVLFCAAAVTAAPSSQNAELQLFDVEEFDLVDTITKLIGKVLEQAKCSVDAIGKVVGESELKPEYEKFKRAVKAVLDNDFKQCGESEKLLDKIKCLLSVSEKLNKLIGGFTKKVLETNKEMAQKILVAIRQCFRKEANVFIMTDEIAEPASFDDDEFTFGLVGAITKKLKQLVEKVKCAVRVTGETIGNGDLKDVFVKFKNDITSFLKKDVKECIQTKGLKAKIECTYYNTVKFNKLYKDFMKTVIQTNKDLAALIVLEVKSQCFDSEKPDSPESDD